MGNITDIEFTDHTSYSHGRYRFYITMDNEEYSGTIKLAPLESRMPDWVEWYGDTPDDWDATEQIVLDKLYSFINNQKQNNYGKLVQ